MAKPALILQYYNTFLHSSDWYMACHQHAFHEIITVESGAMTVLIHGQKFTAGAGQVLFYPSSCEHTEWADPRQPAATLCLGYRGDLLVDQIRTLTDDREGRIRQMLRWAHVDMGLPAEARTRRLQTLVAAVVNELAYLADSPEPLLVTQTRAFVQDRLAQRITLDQLAEHAGMSKYHFLRQYRAKTGTTPMAAVRQQRIDLARNLLICTPWPLRVIAERVGFDNEFHLSRVFRQVTGVPPGSLRKQPVKTLRRKTDSKA